MNQAESIFKETSSATSGWYDLFSRGARDWLRHNDKIRDAVRRQLPEIVAGGDIISRPENRTVQVPVRFLEHYRFRLRDGEARGGAGQGKGTKAGDVLVPAPGPGSGRGGGGNEDGSVEFRLEFKVDELVDWLWEELHLPNLQQRPHHAVEEDDYVREGWDKRGARSRLDRRRTLKEAVKRRAVQDNPAPFIDDDLRFRQLARRPRPATHAAVIFALDVSSSMGSVERTLAKSFFFWVLQGLRRQYKRIETVFIAHTIHAWEFKEEEFFQAHAQGGTVASTAFELALNIFRERFDPARYNDYLFYASDGENFAEDRQKAADSLEAITEFSNFAGYAEVSPHFHEGGGMFSETGRIFRNLGIAGREVASCTLCRPEDIWGGIRRFFQHEAEAA